MIRDPDVAYDEQRQRELDAYLDGREAARAGARPGMCPDYPSRGERDEWLRALRDHDAERLVRYAA